MLRRINDALPGLVLGIIVYGVIVELAGVWFVTDKVRYTTGLLIGISLACGMAVNIATVLRDAVEDPAQPDYGSADKAKGWRDLLPGWKTALFLLLFVLTLICLADQWFCRRRRRRRK